MYQQFQKLKENQSNPRDILTEMTSKYTPEQMQQFRNFVKGFGINDEQLNEIGINQK